MSWGIKIAILYVGFVLLIVFLIIRTSTQNVDLVSDDYYQQELKYQEKINQSIAEQKLTVHPQVVIRDGAVKIIFPDSLLKFGVSGTAFFYRSADASKDVTVELAPAADGTQLVGTDAFAEGQYSVQLTWNSLGQVYYYESQLYIP
jgi:hypothetical protein